MLTDVCADLGVWNDAMCTDTQRMLGLGTKAVIILGTMSLNDTFAPLPRGWVTAYSVIK